MGKRKAADHGEEGGGAFGVWGGGGVLHIEGGGLSGGALSPEACRAAKLWWWLVGEGPGG